MTSKFRVRLRIGTKPNGRPAYKSFCARTKKEAIAKRDRYIEKAKASREGKHTLGQLTEYYCKNVLPVQGLAAGTVELYWRQYEQKVKDAGICLRDITDVSQQDLQIFFTELASGRRDGKKIDVAASALTNTGKFMRGFYRWAAGAGYCEDQMRGVKIPKREILREDVQTFTAEEAKRILETPNRLHFLFVLAFTTGLREAEILGLRYSDIKNGSISITRQLRDSYDVHGNRSVQARKLKSGSSRRVIPLSDFAQEEFVEHRKRHKEEMKEKGYKSDDVFTTSSGRPLDPSNFRTAWGRHLKHAGVEHKKFHACRATFCTELCRAGVDLETAAKLMGHSDVSVTARYYRQISDDETRAAIEKMNTFLGTRGGQKGDTFYEKGTKNEHS
jgi:integrase